MASAIFPRCLQGGGSVSPQFCYFWFTGIIISMKSIDMYILHDSSLGLRGLFLEYITVFLRKVKSMSGFSQVRFCPFPGRLRVSRDYFLVLVFAATRSEMALQSVFSDSKGKMSKLLMYTSKSKKVKMDYSCHD